MIAQSRQSCRSATSLPASPAIRETSSCLFLSLPLAILGVAPACESAKSSAQEKKQGHSRHETQGDHLALSGELQKSV